MRDNAGILARCPTTGSAPRSSVSIIVVPARISSQYVHEAGRAQLQDLFCPVASSGDQTEEHWEEDREEGRVKERERRGPRKGLLTEKNWDPHDLSADWQTLTYILHAGDDIFIGISIHYR